MIAAGSLPGLAAAVVLAPLLPGIIQRVKARFAGRRGPPLLQWYADLARLLRKEVVYSRTTTLVFRAAPVIGLAATLGALALIPSLGGPALISFGGDFLLFAGLGALARALIVLAALDTGSSFEGMGASREAAFSALAEPAGLLAIAAVARATGTISLSAAAAAIGPASWTAAAVPLGLAVAALFIVALAENARVPVDDPATHLELTMIHEVMVLDHSGPDFAFISYAASLKLYAWSSLLVAMLPLRSGSPVVDAAAGLAGTAAVAVAIGVVESCRARIRLPAVPGLLTGAAVLAVLALTAAATA